jgi:secreted trypsin-like serine protease
VISSLDTVIAEDRRLKTRAKPRENGLLNARDYVDNTDVKLDGRIVGGKEAERGEYPYYSKLTTLQINHFFQNNAYYIVTYFYFFIKAFLGNCGGSLIAPSVVLTAAHCHTYIGKNVTVGAEERGKVTGRAVSRLVIDQYLHPEFNHDSYENDYSLLKLDKEVKMDDTDITLTLNFDNDTPKEDQDVTVLGLGVTKHKGRPSKHIKDVELKAVSQEKCAKPYSKMSINDEVQFCAGMIGV